MKTPVEESVWIVWSKHAGEVWYLMRELIAGRPSITTDRARAACFSTREGALGWKEECMLGPEWIAAKEGQKSI